jgi:chromosome segregation ATPase
MEHWAQSKLYNVVVDSDETAKALIKRGANRGKVTFLPLNRLQSKVVERQKVDRAKVAAARVGGEVIFPLEAIEFEHKYLPVMELIFGNVMFTSSIEVSRLVTFNKAIACRTMTAEGDSMDPSGGVSGGYQRQRVAAGRGEWPPGVQNHSSELFHSHGPCSHYRHHQQTLVKAHQVGIQTTHTAGNSVHSTTVVMNIMCKMKKNQTKVDNQIRSMMHTVNEKSKMLILGYIDVWIYYSFLV